MTIATFVKALRASLIQELSPRLIATGRLLSTTPAFPFGRKPVEATKTVFNKVAAGNNFEDAFAVFLERAEDVEAFAKLTKRSGFTFDYTDTATNLRYYEPDFIARRTTGAHVLVETKGQKDIDVAHKDRAATV